MNDALIQFLSILKKREDIYAFSEVETRQSIVLRLLALLGWDPFNNQEVKLEYGVGERRVDFALSVFSTPKVFIEVKKVSEQLAQHEEQLVSYATFESVKLAILTNGITWWFYLPLVEGLWEQKKFYTIDILEQEDFQAAEKFIEFLSKSMTESGEAVEKAEAIFRDKKKDLIIASTLPKAWNKLIQSADDSLIQLLKENTEKLCGYEIDPEIVVRFIQNHQQDITISNSSDLSGIVRIQPKPVGLSSPKPVQGKRGKNKQLRVIINWPAMGIEKPAEVLENDKAVDVYVRALEKIANQVDILRFKELLNFRVNRGMLLSDVETEYYQRSIGEFYVLTKNGTKEKADILLAVAKKFALPKDFVEVEVRG